MGVEVAAGVTGRRFFYALKATVSTKSREYVTIAVRGERIVFETYRAFGL
ncbi:hypothetical protein JCM16163A_06870 [Paenibacillus sp. YK5]|nr:hypothetical protein PN4B1_12270 [Paenibacillus naphthalenovorans]